MGLVCQLSQTTLLFTLMKTRYILIYKAACVSVRPSGPLVPGTNSEIEGLTLANSGTNNICERMGLTIGKSETNIKEWD